MHGLLVARMVVGKLARKRTRKRTRKLARKLARLAQTFAKQTILSKALPPGGLPQLSWGIIVCVIKNGYVIFSLLDVPIWKCHSNSPG